MSEKREKQLHRFARKQYQKQLYIWQINKPSRWRIFRYLKWKKAKPVYERTEKKIKKIIKARG